MATGGTSRRSRERRVDAADAVEDARLAGAVGTDDGEEIAGIDLEAHPGQGGHAAEAQVQVVQSEKCHPLVTPSAVPGEWGETPTPSRALRYGTGVGREKTITVAEPGGALQKNVAFPEVAATYCLPATW